MYIFDIQNKSLLKDVLLENLKTLGVRCRVPKKIKESEKENVYSNHQIFQKPIQLLKKCQAPRLDGSVLDIPEFIVDACGVIEKDIKAEGIFRKAGSTCKQKERKLELNNGKKVSCEYHVFDACSLVKLFFRELPQPLIPYSYHDIFLKCLLLSTYEKELDALLLACLLLPEENLATLAFFMEFLLKVSWHSDQNKMNVKNLAIILTPSLMPVNKGTRTFNNLEMSHHFKVIEMLIENAEKIGQVPDHVIDSLVSSCNKKSKKKRRSGSITRMFGGLKKIVGGRGSVVSDWDESVSSTPDSLSSPRKRRNTDSNSTNNLLTKKKRLLDSSRVDVLTPLRCRMHGYASSVYLIPSPISSSTRRNISQSQVEKSVQKSGDKSSSTRGYSEIRNSRLNLVRRCTTKKQKSNKNMDSAYSMENLFSLEKDKGSTERRLSIISWGKKKTSLSNLFLNKSEPDCLEESSENTVDLSESEFVTVHRSEYENIKNRVSALEEELEILNTVHSQYSQHSVQSAYEKTLEESMKLNEGSTEQLAKRLSKELKIRRSLENKIIRSPSARKIGSIRRRSKEIGQRNSEPRSGLKRGRPNTIQTGLPSPRIRTMSNEDLSAPKKVLVSRSLTFRNEGEEWKSGEVFFAKERLLQKLGPTSEGRPSIAEIRFQNAGMVLEKARLFNSMNESNENGIKVLRRQSVRLENLRRMNDADKSPKKILTRTRSLESDKKLKTGESNSNHDSRKVVHDVRTPKSQKLPVHVGRKETPVIKKALVTRSPRSFARTPLSQKKSSNRSRATPMKALVEAGGTPHTGSRRSPRILARSLNTPSRLRD